MKLRHLLISSLLLIHLLQACSEENGIENVLPLDEADYTDYFFGKDSLSPYILAFQDSAYPIDERFVRFIQLEKNDTNQLIIERYNANLRIYEGVTLNVDDNLTIIDHMMVDKDGLKRKTRNATNAFFPITLGEQIVFKTDFPSHLDSMIMIYESRKHIAKAGLQKEVNGKNHPTILVKDSIFVSLYNVYNGKSSTQKGVVDSYYAKGIGLIQWGDDEGSINYQISKILTDQFWQDLTQE